jgi:hypothetical protein
LKGVSEMLALHFVNLFFAGILAGIEIALHDGLRVPVEALSEDSQLRLRRALVRRLRMFVPHSLSLRRCHHTGRFPQLPHQCDMA